MTETESHVPELRLNMYSKHSAAVAAPPQRRRRPALSCFQCRRRKVKCDQKIPCCQCQRSKDTVCTYSSQASPSSVTHNFYSDQIHAAPQSLHQTQAPDVSNPGYRIPTPDSTTATLSAVQSPHSNDPSTWAEHDHVALRGDASASIVTGRAGEIHKRPFEFPNSVYSPDIERHVTEQESMPDLDRVLRGCPVKSKLFGESHWMNYFSQLDKICAFIFKHVRSEASSQPSDLAVLLQKCKVLGRTIKAEHALDQLTVSDYRDTIPPRDVCDQLVGLYLRTFESLYRILHIPSFQNEYEDYWNDPHSASKAFITKLLLVMAIGTSLWQDPINKFSLRAVAHQWVYLAQHWLSAPLEKSRMNLGGIQVQCLLIMAREVVGVGSDLVWISAGALMRTAMQLGYHRDPKHFPGMSVLHAEMRRRLWATILEIVTQTSYDTAMPPFISLHDFDTKPPSNIDDSEIGKATKTPPSSKPSSTFTQTSLQILLHKSLSIRLEILRLTTNFRSEIPYDEVLRLNTLVTNACRDSTKLVKSYTSSSHLSPPTPFQRNYLDLLTRRPLLSLHRIHCVKARTDPRYYFSRKVCFDTAFAAICFTLSDDYTRLLTTGGGIWRETSSLPAMTICLELIMQLEEEALNPPSPVQLIQAKAAREPLLQAVRDFLILLMDRVREGDVNVKGHLFTAMALGQIEATARGDNAESGIEEAATRSLKESYLILEEKSTAISNTERETQNTAQSWEGGVSGVAYQEISYDFSQDTGLYFDMPDTGLLADWDEQWL